MSQEKPPAKHAWDTMTRHMRRKHPEAAAQPPPEPHAADPPALPESPAPSLVSNSPPPAEERKAAALPTWKKGGFKLTEEQAKIERDPKVQMGRLFDYARNRPVLATLVLLAAVSIVIVDGILLARRLGIDDWLMVNFDLGRDESRRFEVWERQGSALSYFGGGPAKGDAGQASAVDGKDKVPAASFQTPGLSAGLAGIITPEEIRGGMSSAMVGGLDAAVMGGSDHRQGLSGMMVKTAGDNFRPYAPSGTGAGLPIPTGAFFGEAGEALENFGSLKNGGTPAPGYGGPNFAAIQEVPQGLQGDEMVQAMIGDDFKKDMKAYAKEGHWKLHKMAAGEKTVRHELAGLSLTGNNAVLQLLQTKRATDTGLKCGSCGTERRIHNTRAPFFGEEH